MSPALGRGIFATPDPYRGGIDTLGSFCNEQIIKHCEPAEKKLQRPSGVNDVEKEPAPVELHLALQAGDSSAG
jgi:hypothetical protein